ncbi:MAG: sigma-70 family RNA polymerase sigma factor [Flavobacteriales bacterium]|nr:sigma-70 family RNA polymerase sigma factor [Flavobacteriales bacterium]
MDEITEKVLKGCVENDERSRRIIYEQYYKKMYAICLRYSSDSHEAKDMLHDGFIKLFRKTGQVQSVELFEAWAKRLFTNHCIDYLRSAYKKYIRYESEFDENLETEEYEENEVSYFLEDKTVSLETIMDAMNHLRTDYRIILNLYAVEQYSHKQIAELLNMNESTSRSKLLRARQSLKKILLNKN